MIGRIPNDTEELTKTDMRDDVLAAYREVAARAPGDTGERERETPAPAERETPATQEPVKTDEQHRSEGRERGPDGRWVKKEASAEPATARQAGADQQAQQTATTEAPTTEQPDANAALVAPASWTVKAKAQWKDLPPEIKAEVTKREREAAQGFTALRDFKDLKPWVDEAAKHGTTIGKALEHYTAVDRLMTQDLGGGMAVAAHAYGITKERMGSFFAELAQRHGYQFSGSPAPSNGHGSQPKVENDPLAEVLQPMLAPILEQLNALKSQHSQRAEQDRSAQVQSLAQEITRFAADPKNEFYANVEGLVAQIFQKELIPFSGNPAADLQAAYDMAVRMNPETSQVLIERRLADNLETKRRKEQETVDRARQASRSLGGPRTPGTLYREEERATSDDMRAVVEAAYRQHAHA